MSFGAPASAPHPASGRGGRRGGRSSSRAPRGSALFAPALASSGLTSFALATLALGLSACAGPEAHVARGPVEGRPCTSDAQCAPPAYVCKASRCLPLRSRAGEPCVRDGACAPGLVCLLGQCSAGPADAALCANMCRHGALVSAGGLLPGNYAAFAQECVHRCVGRVPREHASCVLRARAPEQLRACP